MPLRPTHITPPSQPSALRFALMAVLGPLILIAFALWLGGEYHRQDGARQQVRQSYQRRIAIADLLSLLKDAETAQRGYVITGDAAFLDQFEPARIALTDHFHRLDRLYAQVPAQRAKLAALDNMVDAKFAEMRFTIDLRRTAGLTAAARHVSDNRGRLLMNRARDLGTQMIAEDDRILAQNQASSRARSARIQAIVWTLVLFSGVALAIGLALLWNTRKARFALEAQAHEAATRLHAIFDATIDGVVLLNPSGSIETVNAAITRMLGLHHDEVVRRDVSLLLDIADEGAGSFADRIGLADGVIAQPIRVDRVARHKDGRAVPVDVALGTMPLPDGMHIVAAIRDISERKAVERMKDEFVSTVSHELRTPLTSVVGSLGLLRGGAAGALPDQAKRLVDIAENNSRRLIRLINDILDLDKIGSGGMRINAVPLDLAALLRRGLEGSEGLADASGVRLDSAIDPGPATVKGDGDRLLQVISNLVSNAIRHTPAGSRVLLALTQEGERAIVTVEDQGPGVPTDFRERIFTRFAQAGGEGTPAGGTGLGLSISREIVKVHGGDLWFEDAPGGGARFRFAIPLWPEPGGHQGRTDEGQPNGGARMLICEDDADVAATLRAMLEREGCVADIVGTAREAEAAARSGRYDALLLDLHLPDASGLSVARALRRRAETRDLPIIVVSASARDGAAAAASNALDLIDWIEKPVDQSRLARAVARAIEHSRAIRPTILHIDDDLDMLEVTATALAGQGRMVKAISLRAARELLAAEAPDIVILDLGLPDGSGGELLPDLFTVDGIAIPTIIYSAQDVSPEVERQVDAVLIKSRRSLPSLEGTIREILSRRRKGA